MKIQITLWAAVILINFGSFAQSPVPGNAVLEKITTVLNSQPEGPVWNDSLGLLFSDIKGNTIYQWSPVDSSTKPYLHPSDSSNGLAYDKSGRLILTQMELRRLARQEFDGRITPLVSTYKGKKFNSPNDIAVKSDGSIFFTDPDFNVPLGQKVELSFKGIYRLDTSGTVKLLDSTFDKPNGICFSPNESRLYVNESPNGKIYVWDVLNDSTISNKRLFYTIPLGGYADGMKVDTSGILYCTGPTGVWIISPDGAYLDKIAMPSNPSNCNWGDADRKTLYITAGNSVYRIRLAETTGFRDKGELPRGMELYQNYPNPFNPATNFGFRISNFGFVSLKIYDLLGNEITTVVEGEFSPGEYIFPFSADFLLSSGTYFYRLQSGESLLTKKFVFIK